MTHSDQKYFDFLDNCDAGKWHKVRPLAERFSLETKEAIQIVGRWIKHNS